MITKPTLQDTATEQALIGSLLTSYNDAGKVVDSIEKIGLLPEMFTDANCKKLFAVLIRQIRENGQPDAAMAAKASGVSIDQISEAMNRAGVPAYAEAYSSALKDLSEKRRIAAACREGLARAESMDWSAVAVLNALEHSVSSIGQGYSRANGGTFGQLLDDTRKEAEESLTRGYGGLPTGVEWFDNTFSGLHAGRLYLISGGAGCGKTTLARQMAVNIAKTGRRVSFVTLELSPAELAKWIACTEAGLSIRDIDCGKKREAVEKYKRILPTLESWPLSISGGAMTPAQFESVVRRDVKAGAELIVLDYLQMLSSDSTDKAETEERRVSKASQAVLQCAIDCNVPILAIASESNAGSLRHSGQLSYDCAGHIQLKKREDATGATVTFPKVRHGCPVSGSIELYFHKGRIVDHDPRTAIF